MLYTTNEGSFQIAATGLEMTEGIKISKTAAHKRIRKSGEWLRWMAQEMCKEAGALVRKPAFLGERNVKLVDASDESTKGKEKNIWRLHYVFNLFEFCCSGMELTSNKEGEFLSRHVVEKDDIFIADRIYCTITGMEHVLADEGDFLLRFKSKAFNLYDEDGERIELLPYLRGLKALKNTDVHCYYKQSGKLRPLRIVAMKKDSKAVEECKRKMARKASRKQEKAAQDDTVELNEYVVLATSLDYTNEQILELYQARWQIEQVFYRLKSLFGYDNVPSKNDDTVKAWFFGKLLLAAICEALLKRAFFPPELEPIIVDFVGTQFVDRVIFDS
jgi:IS4 transposase